MCKYALINKCDRGENCTFAHDISELRIKPDMRKTKLCKSYILGKCTDHNCIYAHSVNELREVGKPAICQLHREGRCIKGNQCRFAHSINDINTKLVQFYGNEENSNEEESSMSNLNNCLNMINSGKSSMLNKMKGYVDLRNENEEIIQTVNKNKNEIWNLNRNINDSSSNSSILSNNLYNAMANNKKNIVKNMNRTNLIKQTSCNTFLNDNPNTSYIKEKKEDNQLNNRTLKNTKLCAITMNKDQSYDYNSLLLDNNINNNKNYLLTRNINKLNNIENPLNGNILNESFNQNVSSLNLQSFLSFNSPQQMENNSSNSNLNNISTINDSINYELMRKLDNVETTLKNHIAKSNKGNAYSMNFSSRGDEVVMNNIENNLNSYNSCNKNQKSINKLNQIITNSNNLNNKNNDYILNNYISKDTNLHNDNTLSRNNLFSSIIHNNDILNKNKKNGSTHLVYNDYSMNEKNDDSNNENNYIKPLNKINQDKLDFNYYNIDESLKYFGEYLYKNDEKKNIGYSENRSSSFLNDTNNVNDLKKIVKENTNLENMSTDLNKNKREKNKCINYYENIVLNGNHFDMKTLLPKLMDMERYLKMDDEKKKNKLMNINAYLNENMNIKNSFNEKFNYVENVSNSSVENINVQDKKRETCENVIKYNFSGNTSFKNMNDENRMDTIDNDNKVIIKKSIYQNELDEENKNEEKKEAGNSQKEISEELKKRKEEIDKKGEKIQEKDKNDVDSEKEDVNRLNKMTNETIFNYPQFENGIFNDSSELKSKQKNNIFSYNVSKNDSNIENSKFFLKGDNMIGTTLKNFEEFYLEKLNEYKNCSHNNNNNNPSEFFKYIDNSKMHKKNLIQKKKDDYVDKEENNINIIGDKCSNIYDDNNEINNYNNIDNNKKNISNNVEEQKRNHRNLKNDYNESNINENNDNNNYTNSNNSKNNTNIATSNNINSNNSNNTFIVNNNDNNLKDDNSINMNKDFINYEQGVNLNYDGMEKREHYDNFNEEKQQKLISQNINKNCVTNNNIIKGNSCNLLFENNSNNYYISDISNKKKFENKSWINNKKNNNIINVNDVIDAINNCKKNMNDNSTRNSFNLSALDINANNSILINLLQESIVKNEENLNVYNKEIEVDTSNIIVDNIKNRNNSKSNDINSINPIKNSCNNNNNNINDSNKSNRNGSNNQNIKNNNNDNIYNNQMNEKQINNFFYDNNDEKILSNNMNCKLYEEINDLKDCNLIKNRKEDSNSHNYKFPKLNSISKNKIISTTNYIDKKIFKNNSFSNFGNLNENFDLNKEANMHTLNEENDIIHFKDKEHLEENQNRQQDALTQENKQNRAIFKIVYNKPNCVKESEEKIYDFNLNNLSMDYMEMNNENNYLNSSSTRALNSFRINAETSISNNTNTGSETNNNNNTVNKENSYIDNIFNNNKLYQKNYLNDDNFDSIETIMNIDAVDNSDQINTSSNKTSIFNNNNSKLNFLKNDMFLNNNNNSNKNSLNFFDSLKNDYNFFEISTNNASSFFNYDISKRAENDFSNLMANNMSSNNALNNNSCLYNVHFENKSFVNDEGDCMKFSNDINFNFLNKSE
ncbi:zinc finger protein, putative [Plasmodium relictum]|uniref:Zinc finger protein, putative n=1 Tax=Plasmodium relictum TaxID=85471 RepID=A0A1J1H2W9_PLARL|nr:zinc finger protein, putative [Plasmodium relictum]CRG99054.1 zinc finger protein, putative [Plasmodium relictum]